MTHQNQWKCPCGGDGSVLDKSRGSCTIQCESCRHCSLATARFGGVVEIFLSDFHHKRGDEPGQRQLHELSMATELVRCLVNDVWPSMATVIDYGIESPSHLGTLQHAVRCGCTAYDLDRVMGDGPAITQLVRTPIRSPYGEVVFRTAYDEASLLDVRSRNAVATRQLK